MDQFARVRSLIGTTAEWNTNDIVCGDGEIAIERVTSTECKIKVGDGVKKFSALPYIGGGASVAGTLVLKGAVNPTAAAPATPAVGDLYIANAAGNLHASWGVAGNPAVSAGDMLVRETSTSWVVIPTTSDLTQKVSKTEVLSSIGDRDVTVAMGGGLVPKVNDVVTVTKAGTPHASWVGLTGPVHVADQFMFNGTAWVAVDPLKIPDVAIGDERYMRSQFLQAGTGAVARTSLSKLRDTVSVKDFGAVGDGVADDTAAWQLWINYCASAKVGFICEERLTSRITGKLVFPLVVISMPGGARALPIDLRGVDFLWDGPRNDIAIDIGEAPSATGYYPETDIWLPRLSASGALQWPGLLGATDIGVRIRQAFRCRIHENFIYGFTNGIVYSGCAYNTMFGKHVSDSKFGLVCTTEGANHDASFFNENTRIGGKIGNTSSASGLGNAFMILFTWDKVSSYRGHNANRFIAPCLESNGSATYQMPIWFDGAGAGGNSFDHVRVEGCKGPVALFDGGGGNHGVGTTINLDYIAYAGQEISLRQVNGACGNILTGVGCNVSSWNSGDLTKAITSAGAAGTAWLRGSELFFVNASTPTAADFKRIETVFTTAVRANRQGVQLDAGGVFRIGTAFDTTRIKDFECSFESLDSFIGRPCFIALDSQGNLLSGLATETFANPLTGATYANEQYVKGIVHAGDAGQQLSSAVAATTGADSAPARSMRITVRPEVATLVFSVLAGSTAAVVKSLSVIAYATYDKVGEAAYPLGKGRAALRMLSLVDDDGAERIATAKPDTAGTLGYYGRGVVVYNRSAASGVTAGWQCSSAGWLCPAWVASTAYATPGMLVTNDTGKIYELTTPGTSASSGGPTGTTATWDGITDGTCKWRYIGTLATFTALPNNP